MIDPLVLGALVLAALAVIVLVYQASSDPEPAAPASVEPQIVRVPIERELETITVSRRRQAWRDVPRVNRTLWRWADRRVERERRRRRILARPVEMAWSDSIGDDWLKGQQRFLITYAWVHWPRAAGTLPAEGWQAGPGDSIELALEVRR